MEATLDAVETYYDLQEVRRAVGTLDALAVRAEYRQCTNREASQVAGILDRLNHLLHSDLAERAVWFAEQTVPVRHVIDWDESDVPAEQMEAAIAKIKQLSGDLSQALTLDQRFGGTRVSTCLGYWSISGISIAHLLSEAEKNRRFCTDLAAKARADLSSQRRRKTITVSLPQFLELDEPPLARSAIEASEPDAPAIPSSDEASAGTLGISAFDISLIVSENDSQEARKTNREWTSAKGRKKIQAKPIGKCPIDRRASLYELPEILKDATKYFGLSDSQKRRYRKELTPKLRAPRAT